MQRIWRALVGQRHQPKGIELSADPLFIDKACDADGPYLARALVPCADGNCRMQALDRAQPILPRRPGTLGRCTSDGKRLVGLVDAAREVRIDDDATHKASRIRAWLARRPRWHLHRTPTGPSWLNMVERCCAEPTERQIERGAHRSVGALETAGMASVEHPSHNPRPCEWARAADRTLAVVKSFRERVAARSDRAAIV